MAFGVEFSVLADLGTSPVSSIPYVTNLISGVDLGYTTMIVNALDCTYTNSNTAQEIQVVEIVADCSKYCIWLYDHCS